MNGIIAHLASILSRSWWVMLLRAVAAITFGVLTFVWPGISLASLVLLFGAYCMADGILTVWTAVSGSKDHEYWWLLLLEGLLGCKQAPRLGADRRCNILIELPQRPDILVKFGRQFTHHHSHPRKASINSRL
jgi:hypothetical protein